MYTTVQNVENYLYQEPTAEDRINCYDIQVRNNVAKIVLMERNGVLCKMLRC